MARPTSVELSGSSLTAHMALEDPKTQTQDTKRSDGVVRVYFAFNEIETLPRFSF